MPSSKLKRNFLLLFFICSILLIPFISLGEGGGSKNIDIDTNTECSENIANIANFGIANIINGPPLSQYYKTQCNNVITQNCLLAIATALDTNKNGPPLNLSTDLKVKEAMANDIAQLATVLRNYALCPDTISSQEVETARQKVQNDTAVSFEGVANQVGARNETNIEREVRESESGPCGLVGPATVGDVFKSLLNPIDSVIGGIIYGLFVIARGFLVWCLKIFQWLLNPSNFGGYINFLKLDPRFFNYTTWRYIINLGIPESNINTPSLVQQLWGYIRNFANLGIIIGMIIVAIATILRIEKFSWKKMLPKLFLVALLVNFSLVIAGIFVDISNFITIASVNNFNNISLSTVIVDQTICPVVQSFYHLGSWWKLVEAASMGLVLSSIFLFQFVGLVFYVFSRIITIIICLFTSPLAFLSFAIPGGEKVWDFWRQRFQQAIIILPVLCFTLFLSLKFISLIVTYITTVTNEGYFIITLAYAGFIIAFAQLVRYVAKFLGVEQVEKGFQMAKKAANTLAMAGAAAVGGFALGRITQSGWYNNLARGLSAEEGMAGARGGLRGFVSRGLSTQLYKIKGVSESKQAEKEQKELDKIKNDEAALNNESGNAMALHNTRKVLRIMAMKAKADLGSTPEERQFILHLPAQFRHSEDARTYYTYNPAARLDDQGNQIPMNQLVNRAATTPVGNINMREVLLTLDETLQRQFIHDTLGPARDAKEVADFIQKIPVRHQQDFMTLLHNNVLQVNNAPATFHEYLDSINHDLVEEIEHPRANATPYERNRISLITRVWDS